MPTNNFVAGAGASASSAVATSSPQAGDPPQFWDNGGTLTYWDGTQNKVLDFNEGPNQSVFGTPLGDQ